MTDSTSSESGAVTTTTVVTEAPGETTVTTEEFGPPDYSQSDSSQISGQARQSTGTVSTNSDHSSSQPARESPSGANGSGTPAAITSRNEKPMNGDSVRHGPLVKRTVTVTRSGGEKTETVQQATTQGAAASETKAAGEADATAKGQEEGGPSAGCIGASWLWGAAVLVGVVGIVYFAVKLRRAA